MGASLYKLAFFILLAINARSLPFAWHLRVFRPVFYINARRVLAWLRARLSPRPHLAMDAWYERIPPVGADPFALVIKYNSWVAPDDGDFNGHLSNSSYGKSFDAARFKAALVFMPAFLRVGGWIALGGTHYTFIREIPIFARYELRMRVVGWGDKWFYVVGRFVSLPAKSSKSKSKAASEQLKADTENTSSSSFKASIRTPANPLDTLSASPSAVELVAGSGSSTPTPSYALASTPEPDGATLHCIALSQLCFKHGRITVPPALVLASNGFSRPPPSTGTSSTSSETEAEAETEAQGIEAEGDGGKVEAYSHAHPPPHWEHVLALRSAAKGGSTERYVRFLRGGWREVPASTSSPTPSTSTSPSEGDANGDANGDATANGDAQNGNAQNGHAEGHANGDATANGDVNGHAKANGDAKGAETYPGGRWWEDALGGPIEVTRAANMVALDGLRAGMDAVRAMG
ncbi:hypothetical protein PLICRDRAFT_46932 [Plicaturopsis crispa FD-325 SS-3]|uniref:Thioesterase domain-containing protein n=1 Tax=Plicaturopsis crispa FD-325 SS-3 TaxID=944288 RepID=A0A0C9T3C9_PLICR|nr:hypothetical protein PLICRDRAFT_46932 [Plicaturopsis crispa FD-325 SS-3]